MELTRAWVADVVGGRVAGTIGASEPIGSGLAFDSRRLASGEVFVAIRDERDGHDFVADAFTRGAAFAIVERAVADGPLVEVEDSRGRADRAGQGRASPARRARGRHHRLGRQDLDQGPDPRPRSARPCEPTRRRRRSTTRSACRSRCSARPRTREAVIVEMGARFAGNIAELCALAPPEIGVITNIGVNHAEHLGGPEGVARVKGELLDALPAHGLAVVDVRVCRHGEPTPPECGAGAHGRSRSRRGRAGRPGDRRRRPPRSVPTRDAVGERRHRRADPRRPPGDERGPGGGRGVARSAFRSRRWPTR